MSLEPPDPAREHFRHELATLAYRGGKALRGAPAGFAGVRAGDSTRPAVAILAHVADLLDWALWLARGQDGGQNSVPGTWDVEVKRFYATLSALDAYVASFEPLAASPAKLFQGPIADAFTHVGQLTLLRRLAGAPVRGENYFVADIQIGRLGPEQSPPRREFD